MNILLCIFSGCDTMYLISKVILAHWLVFTNLGENNFMIETWYFLNFALNGYFLLFFPIFAIFTYCNIWDTASICNWFAESVPTPDIPATFRLFGALYMFQSADPSVHSVAFQRVCVYATSTCTSQIQTATAADLKLCRTSIPPCSVISL